MVVLCFVYPWLTDTVIRDLEGLDLGSHTCNHSSTRLSLIRKQLLSWTAANLTEHLNYWYRKSGYW